MTRSQGDQEKEVGLPVSPFMDRDNSLPGKMVVGFVDFFVLPLYTLLVRLPRMYSDFIYHVCRLISSLSPARATGQVAT